MEQQTVVKINTIENIIRQFITKNKSLQNIIMDVEIIEMRDYNGMCFLKVSDGTGSIKAVIYRNTYILEIKAGDKINIDATLSSYHMDLQLIINSYSHVGEGDHNAKLAVLKKRLEKAGYFDNKPVLKDDYNTIGVVSSLNAAGLKDFLTTINSRCQNKTIYIYPSSVQGLHAPTEICNAIELANRHVTTEILVLIRGGGSKEDLECFNSEILAKNIHSSKIPIVTGIGHQIDTSIADLVAAKSFITPTSAGQNITRENVITKTTVYQLMSTLTNKILNRINTYHDYLINAENKIAKYRDQFLEEIMTSTKSNHKRRDVYNHKLVFTMNCYQSYLINSQISLYETWSNYYNNIQKQLGSYRHRLSSGTDLSNKIIEVYNTELNILTKPKVINKKSGKEIKYMAEILEGKEYILEFIDGDYSIKT